MSPFVRRLLISILSTIVILALCGYALSQAASLFVANERDSGKQMIETLQWRLPVTLAACGGGLVFLMEVGRHFWVRRVPKTTTTELAKPLTPDQEAEQLLLQLLEQNESAKVAASVSLTQTPPTVGLPMPVPDFAEPTTTCG
jgi:hypothetical protein